MKVHVDQDRCQGHGRCYSLAPELFEPDEIGNGIERNGGEIAIGAEANALRAARNCPELAITVEGADL